MVNLPTGGRLAWAAVSDMIGRRKTLMIFTAGSIPLYMFLPSMVEGVVSTGSTLPLYAFCASTTVAVSMMGGVYAILPAYEADLFGTRFAGAVHGRMLLFSSLAALTGTLLLHSLTYWNHVTEILFCLVTCTIQDPRCSSTCGRSPRRLPLPIF
jgi:MFS family permease